MALSVAFEDDGTIWVKRPGSEEVQLDADDVERMDFPAGEKAFLRSMFRYAVPGPVACPVRRDDPVIQAMEQQLREE